jgi:hypothetical protein
MWSRALPVPAEALALEPAAEAEAEAEDEAAEAEGALGGWMLLRMKLHTLPATLPICVGIAASAALSFRRRCRNAQVSAYPCDRSLRK